MMDAVKRRSAMPAGLEGVKRMKTAVNEVFAKHNIRISSI